MATVRFATIGTSEIARQFLLALPRVGGAEYVAAYSRDLARARDFGEPFGARLFFDSLGDLAACPEVDAVYVASPNALHARQAAEMVGGGKHVLVEKPFASNEREAREVFRAAREAGVVALEAVRSLHVPAFGAIERAVREDLGRVRRATLRFSKITSRIARLRAGERINAFDPALAGGALMDIGVYCVEPAIALFGEPRDVRALAVGQGVPGAGEGDPCSWVDLSGSALLGYDDKVVELSYGKISDDVLPCEVEGERATLVWDQVSCPANLRVHEHVDQGMVFRSQKTSARGITGDAPEHDMAFETGDFVAAIRGEERALRDRERFEGVTLSSLRVMDRIRQQVGVRFPADLGA